MTCARHAAALAAALVLALACGTPSASAQSVLQHHNSATRQGFYTSSGLAKADVSKTARVSTINTVLNGAVYAQLLYYSHKGVDVVIAATETNHVTAVNVVTGRVVFDKVRLWFWAAYLRLFAAMCLHRGNLQSGSAADCTLCSHPRCWRRR